MEPRKLSIRNPTALFEALDNIALDTAKQGYVLRKDREVIRRRRAREVRSVFSRQKESAAIRIDFDDSPGDHRAQPFANIALVELCLCRDLIGATGGKGAHDI